ncbi:8569_t:CDS:2 [Funneliformis mosseae]|uniref:8569_t:CDS:1 n=1 Tax=Funneliformis mosseae TaxID=27381 RepID=A0A9N8VWF7_FUNMO|nr:8569_t:CDS:2 [Funneliformis mosseae]
MTMRELREKYVDLVNVNDSSYENSCLLSKMVVYTIVSYSCKERKGTRNKTVDTLDAGGVKNYLNGESKALHGHSFDLVLEMVGLISLENCRIKNFHSNVKIGQLARNVVDELAGVLSKRENLKLVLW